MCKYQGDSLVDAKGTRYLAVNDPINTDRLGQRVDKDETDIEEKPPTFGLEGYTMTGSFVGKRVLTDNTSIGVYLHERGGVQVLYYSQYPSDLTLTETKVLYSLILVRNPLQLEIDTLVRDKHNTNYRYEIPLSPPSSDKSSTDILQRPSTPTPGRRNKRTHDSDLEATLRNAQPSLQKLQGV